MIAAMPGHIELTSESRMLYAPRERISPSEWADWYRMLQGSYCAEPGQWRTSRTPYLQAVMDSMADPTCREIVFLKSSRVGGTEAMNNMLGWAIDCEPGPILYVYPTEGDAKEECRDRLVPMIEGSPRLRDHIPYEGWDTKGELTLDSGHLYMAWAKSPRTLVRRTIRYVVIDELDSCDKQAGFLGNIKALASDRLSTFGHRGKMVIVCTPTTPSGAGWKAWEASDRRLYHVPCPYCGTYQVLVHTNVRPIAGEEDCRDPDRIGHHDLARYWCASCNEPIAYTEWQSWMVARGVWVPTARRKDGKLNCELVGKLDVDNDDQVERAVWDHPDRFVPRIEGKQPYTLARGFHLSYLYSPWRTWSEGLARWWRAYGRRDILRVFTNSWLGEPWEETIGEVDVQQVRSKRRHGLPRGVVPDEALGMIAGADVQQDRCYYVIRAWGRHQRSWLVKEGVADTLEMLYEIVSTPLSKSNGDQIRPQWLAIDSGFRTKEVYEFARTHAGVRAMKGEGANKWTVRSVPIEYDLDGKAVTQSIRLHLVNVAVYKEMIYARMAHALGDPGYWGIHRDTSEDYCEQVCAEHQVERETTRGGSHVTVAQWELKIPGAANHFLDCEVYVAALADHEGWLKPEPGTEAPPSKEPPRHRQEGQRWLDNRARIAQRRRQMFRVTAR